MTNWCSRDCHDISTPSREVNLTVPTSSMLDEWRSHGYDMHDVHVHACTRQVVFTWYMHTEWQVVSIHGMCSAHGMAHSHTDVLVFTCTQLSALLANSIALCRPTYSAAICTCTVHMLPPNTINETTALPSVGVRMDMDEQTN